MSRVILPFNYQPVLSEVKQTTYEIPAGHYARITPISADVAIDGLGVCVGKATTFNTGLMSPGDFMYLGSLSRPFYVSWSRTSGNFSARLAVSHTGGGTSGSLSPLTLLSTSGSYHVDGYAHSGQVGAQLGVAQFSGSGSVFLSNSSSGSTTTAYDIQINPIHMPSDLWVAEGAEITGERYFVSLYRSLT
jgi:hypothetical protein